MKAIQITSDLFPPFYAFSLKKVEKYFKKNYHSVRRVHMDLFEVYETEADEAENFSRDVTLSYYKATFVLKIASKPVSELFPNPLAALRHISKLGVILSTVEKYKVTGLCSVGKFVIEPLDFHKFRLESK